MTFDTAEVTHNYTHFSQSNTSQPLHRKRLELCKARLTLPVRDTYRTVKHSQKFPARQ